METRKIAITASMENVSLTLAILKMDPVNPEKNATIDGINRKRKEAPQDQTTRLPAEAVEACAVKDVEVVVAAEKAVELAVVVTEEAA